MLRLVAMELKPLLRAWPALLLAILASAVYVVGEGLRSFNGWALLGRTTGIWVSMWFYLAYFPTALSYGWFRNEAQREGIWVRRASTSRLLWARFLALGAVGLGVWGASVALGFAVVGAVHGLGPGRPWALVKMALFSLPTLGFGLALLLFVASWVRHRATAYALAVAYFILMTFSLGPRSSAYLFPHFFPSDRLISEYVGLASFAAVMYAQKGYALLLALGLVAAAAWRLSLRRRPPEWIAGFSGLVLFAAALLLAVFLLRQPSLDVWAEKVREDWTGLATDVGTGSVPPDALFYRVYPLPAAPVDFTAFAKPADGQVVFVAQYVSTLELLEKGDRITAAVEVPYRRSSAVRSGVLLVPERYRYRERSRCERSAVREAVNLLLPVPAARALLQQRGGRTSEELEDLKRRLAEIDRAQATNLLAQWLAVHALLGEAFLKEELELWQKALAGNFTYDELQARGIVGGSVSLSRNAVRLALERWEELGVAGVRRYVFAYLSPEGRAP